MEKYRRVMKSTDPSEKETAPNVVRITQKGVVGSYVSYVVKLLDTKEPLYTSIYLKAMGNALPKAIVVAEKLRTSKEGLHQVVKVEQIETITVYEPLEEGLDIVEIARQIPIISIQLSYLIDEIDIKDIGYQKPLSSNFIKSYHEHEKQKYKKSHKFKKHGKSDNEQEKENVKQDTNNEETNDSSSPIKKNKKNGRKGKTMKENQDIEVVEDEQVQDEETKKGPKRKKSGMKKHDKMKQENTENVENDANDEEVKEQVDGNETKTKGSERKHRSYSNRGRRLQRGGRGNGQQVESSEKTTEEATANAS